MRGLSIRKTVGRPIETVHRWTTLVPADLVFVGGFVCLAVVVLTVIDSGSLLVRAVIGVPFLFLAPGYATVAVLFPRSARDPDETGSDVGLLRQTKAITDVERAALSFGVSIAVLPLLGLVIAVFPWGFTRLVVVGTVGGFVCGSVLVAVIRRVRVSPAERYRIHARAWIGAVRTTIFGANSRTHVAVNVGLVLSMLLAVTTVGYALAAPQQGEAYTSAQLLTETADGEYVAGGYPTTFTEDQPQELTIALENNEQRETEYEIVPVIERVDASGEQVVVRERQELDHLETTLEDGETWRNQHDIEPALVGDDLRMSYYVYVDEPPAEIHSDTAYRHMYLWITVEAADG